VSSSGHVKEDAIEKEEEGLNVKILAPGETEVEEEL
jgi:hypothetical protein